MTEDTLEDMNRVINDNPQENWGHHDAGDVHMNPSPAHQTHDQEQREEVGYRREQADPGGLKEEADAKHHKQKRGAEGTHLTGNEVLLHLSHQAHQSSDVGPHVLAPHNRQLPIDVDH